jgi:hypothetical protein
MSIPENLIDVDGTPLIGHLFTRVESGLSATGMRIVDAYTPSDEADAETEAETYKLMRDYLEDGADEAFANGEATAFCRRHNKCCAVFGSIDYETAIDLTDVQETINSNDDSQDKS